MRAFTDIKLIKSDCKAQAFTLESIAAALLLLVVAYFLFRSTLIIAPQSTQVVDVQLSQYAKDTLRILDNPSSPTNDTLEYVLEHLNSSDFEEVVAPLVNATKECLPKDVGFNFAVYYYNYTTKKVEKLDLTNFVPSSSTVTASRYIVLDSKDFVSGSPFVSTAPESGSYPVVVEVRLTLWRV